MGNSNKFRKTCVGRAFAFSLAYSIAALLLSAPAHCADAVALKTTTPDELAISQAVARVSANPQDPRARYALGDAYKKAGKLRQAAAEFLEATAQDPTYYLAYHQLTTVKPQEKQLDEAVARLTSLKEEHPTALMLRVALSELFEQKGDYYHGARVLVDLVYQNKVEPKYVDKVNARIHYLLSKGKSADVENAQPVEQAEPEEGADIPAPPLPETTLHRNLRNTGKSAKAAESFGHANLLP